MIGATPGSLGPPPPACRRKATFLLALIAAAPALLLTACGSQDRSDHSTGPNDPATSVQTTQKPKPDRTTPDKPPILTGRFEATPGDNYTVAVDYRLNSIDTTVDISNAKPGQAFVIGSAVGQLTITNTTPHRNTTFRYVPSLYIKLFWPKSDVPNGFSSRILYPHYDVCDLRFRAVAYCALATIYFGDEDIIHGGEIGEELTLEPREAVSVTSTSPLDSVVGPAGSLVVEETYAAVLARFVRSTPPSLVGVYGGQAGKDELQISCATEVYDEVEGPNFNAGPVGLVDAAGYVLAEGGGITDLSSGALKCSAV